MHHMQVIPDIRKQIHSGESEEPGIEQREEYKAFIYPAGTDRLLEYGEDSVEE